MTINYPRSCEICGYAANNPAMYFYHKKTHDPIPEGTLCYRNCGKLATVCRTNGKYVCSPDLKDCKSYIEKLSNSIKNMWADEKYDKRKKQNGERVRAWSKETRQIANEKQTITKRNKRLSLEQTYDRKKYGRAVHYHSQKNYRLNKEVINPDNNEIGLRKYHLDHKVSQFVGYLIGIPIDIISSVENLAIIPAQINTVKCSKCSLHPLKLLEMVNADKPLIDSVKQKLHLVEHLIDIES